MKLEVRDLTLKSRVTTPMMKQYLAIKEQHPDCLLFFRMGDFYEMFFEDAELAARELEIALTARDGGKNVKVPMAGVPHHAADSYLARLLERGHKVAICDQVEDPRQAKGLVRREVVRVVTPGTVIDEKSLETKQNNYVASLVVEEDRLGLAVADVSTGHFSCTEITGDDRWSRLSDELAAYAPAECLVEPGRREDTQVRRVLEQAGDPPAVEGPEWIFIPAEARRALQEHFGVHTLDGYGLRDRPTALRAAGALLSYCKEVQMTEPKHITGLRTYEVGQYMVIDSAARRNLELVKPLSGERKGGTLLETLDHTHTAMGGRLLRSWLERPLLEPAAVNQRLDAVEYLLAEAFLRADLESLLRHLADLERLASKAVYGRANARDLIALRESLLLLPRLRELLRQHDQPHRNGQAGGAGGEDEEAEKGEWGEDLPPLLAHLAHSIDPLEDLAGLLQRALADEPPAVLTEGGLIRSGYHQEVDRLRSLAGEGKAWIAELEAQERQRTGIKSLKVGYNKVFGYYLEVTRANQDLVPPDYQRKQTLVNSERYITPELKEKEADILRAEERLVDLEYRLYTEIREQVAGAAPRILGSARAVAQLDALTGLASVASHHHYVRPWVDDSLVIDIRAGRHPVLERQDLGEPFVPNDCFLDGDGSHLCIITGPNMAGKSTYMRQAALIVIMAQMGSFVPAGEARVGVVDRVFTRVGAADDLAGGKSTFMVEMTEVANILNNATRRSLLVLDEVGRGTSTFDGISIAWAVCEFIHRQPHLRCRTLFATHYHELTALAASYEGMDNYSVSVKERGDDIVFLHRVVRGPTDRSYGLQVARLAGVPPEVVGRARALLARLEEQSARSRAAGGQAGVAGRAAAERASYEQVTLLEVREHPVLEQLRGLDVLKMTPIEALNTLHRLREMVVARGRGERGDDR